jgi:Glycosyl transferases group 1
MQAGISSLFISYRDYVEGNGGGVQVCTREYLNLINIIGIHTQYCLFSSDRRASTRVARNLFTSPYFRPAEPSVLSKIGALQAGKSPDFIFLNQVSLAALAPDIKKTLPRSKTVLLSHGLESTDFLHTVKLKKTLPLSYRWRPSANIVLGDMILKEARFRAAIDMVCTLSPFDADLERWIGARRVCWLPRSIRSVPIDWAPAGNRFGFVGTLDHAPNLDGLVQVLDCFDFRDPKLPRIRVVGGPEAQGRWLKQKYPFVDYLGHLGNSDLEQEAATWNLILHPIFCLPRGCSTKLATALAWQIPIVTTTFGCRGYVWHEGQLTLADHPKQFAVECLRLLDAEQAQRARSEVIAVCASSPGLSENAAQLAKFLLADAESS